MKNGFIILLLALLLGIAGYSSISWYQTRQDPTQWLGQQLGLQGEELNAFTAAHEAYEPFCADMCQRIYLVDQELARLIRQNASVTPEIEAAMLQAETLRAQCRLGMLKHFYTASALLPGNRRDDYLRLVIPLVTSAHTMPDPIHTVP